MDIRINRFNVRHQGEFYGPGDVIYGVNEKDGRKLVEESNGELEELPSRSETVAGQEDEGGGSALPPIDPSKTVK